jgi:circadian clock protein KaiC
MRLINHCKDKGISVLLVNQSQGGMIDRQAISGLGISSLIDAIVWLSFAEAGDKFKRLLLVIKSRGSDHSTQYHDFRITNQGIKLSKDPAAKGKVNRRAIT